jgi:hypothetical protein
MARIAPMEMKLLAAKKAGLEDVLLNIEHLT